MYYKLVSLKNAGYEIYFHTFLYNRKSSDELEAICKKVFYYPRQTGLLSHFHYLPYIVYSRRSQDLLNNLKLRQSPILFEGLHSCFYLNSKAIRERIRIVRTHNIEHDYYFHLFKAEKNNLRKLFFLIETIKLKFYQPVLKKASSLAAISSLDAKYFSSLNKETFLLHPFHSNSKVDISMGKSNYYLYHANLEVPENKKAAWFLIANVFSKLNLKLVIAGNNPESSLRDYISGQPNIVLVENPSENEMDRLIKEAHAIVLYTKQSTGVKLKLLESLFKGRFCITNAMMVAGTGLEKACLLTKTASEYISQIKRINSTEFSNYDLENRKRILESYLPENNIGTLIKYLEG